MGKYPKRSDILVYAGKTLMVEWYSATDGGLPAFEYYLEMSEAEQDRLDYMIRYFADAPVGTMLPDTMYRVEDRENRIYAFKPGAQRIFNFTTSERKIIMTNAYRKHSRKMTRKDLRILLIAVECRNDYQKRVKEGTYYEKPD